MNNAIHKQNNLEKFRNAHISSSGSFFSAFFAMHWKAASTLNPSFADVSK